MAFGGFNGGAPLQFVSQGPPTLAPNVNEVQQVRSWQDGEGYRDYATTGSSTSELQYTAVHDRAQGIKFRDGQTQNGERARVLLNAGGDQYRCDANDPDSCLVQPGLGAMNFGRGGVLNRTWVNPGQKIETGTSADLLSLGLTQVNGRDLGFTADRFQ